MEITEGQHSIDVCSPSPFQYQVCDYIEGRLPFGGVGRNDVPLHARSYDQIQQLVRDVGDVIIGKYIYIYIYIYIYLYLYLYIYI